MVGAVGGGVSRVGGGVGGVSAAGVIAAGVVHGHTVRDARATLLADVDDELNLLDEDDDDDKDKPPKYTESEVAKWNEQAFQEYYRRVKRLYRIHQINITNEDVFLNETRQV